MTRSGESIGYVAQGYYRQFWQKQGTVVAGSWSWNANASQTDWASVQNEGAGYWYNGAIGANGDEYKWSNVFLAAGNYKFTILSTKGPLNGIMQVVIGAKNAQFDLYTAGTSYNQLFTITHYQPIPQLLDIRFRANGHNASSSGYSIMFSRFQLEQTA